MGSCVSVSLPCDQVVNQFSRWLCVKVSYVRNLSKNIEALQKVMRVLRAQRDDVQGRVEREEFTRRRLRLFQIQVWLTDVLNYENEYSELLSTSDVELQRSCLCGFCSKNAKMSYLYGKQVVLALKEVESLITRGRFDVVTEEAPIPEVEELPIQPMIVGQETMLERVWNRLMRDKIVGIYGMGGVGKTTLLTQINNKFSRIGCRFDVVMWVVVSKYARIHKIQGDIGEKLGLGGKEWDDKNTNQKALEIHKVLKTKKFVLLLDDLWEKVNLNEIGVPYPNNENGCRVAFTTRSRDVCGCMGVNDPIEVRCLDTDKAWDLFREKVGKDTLESHPDITDLARKVAEKCDGLPLALNIIGETMASKNTVQEWHRAVDVLTLSAAEFSGMEDVILPILKYSYDSLNGEGVKTGFLYCSLFPEDDSIEKERLIEYWVGEGLIDENEGRERALNQGYEILGTLVRACLLLENESKSDVKMHDVVREMALWVASDLGKHKERCIVQAGVGLRELPDVKNWKKVTRLSLMENMIENIYKIPECPQLTTLFLQKNMLTTISGEFFRSMSRLLALDLSDNEQLQRLPEQISELVSLRFLDLSWTSIKRLPDGLQALKMLIHLNFEYTLTLESLHGISNLSSLRTLKLRFSGVWLDISLIKELQLLQQLEFISINISSSLVGDLLVYDPRVGGCIKELFIKGQEEESVRVLVLPPMNNLHKVYIQSCGMKEIKIEKIPLNKNLPGPCFSNFSVVGLQGCHGLKDLTWLLFAPNLIDLGLADLEQLEEVISREKSVTFLEMNNFIILPFRKLQSLDLNTLPELKSIYWNALPFQYLKVLEVRNCPKLRHLPLDSQSVSNVENFDIEYGEKEWIQEIEWKDEATRHRFLPSCKFLPYM